MNEVIIIRNNVVLITEEIWFQNEKIMFTIKYQKRFLHETNKCFGAQLVWSLSDIKKQQGKSFLSSFEKVLKR